MGTRSKGGRQPWCRLKVTVDFPHLRALLLCFPLAILGLAAQAQSPSAHPAQQKGALVTGKGHSTAPASLSKTTLLLPPAFAGAPREGGVVTEPTPADADQAHAAVLKEDGLTESNVARYGGAGAGSSQVEVLRFGDATGAFAAFTFYRDPAMRPEALGDNAAAGPGVFLVQKHNVLVRVTGASGNQAGLRSAVAELVASLRTVSGPEAVLPILPSLLPPGGLQKQTVHYAIGPAGYNGPIPASAIDFRRDAEAVTAAYRLASGKPATLTLIMLPTPQIANAALQAIHALPAGALHVAVRRSGPLAAVVSGEGIPQADAERLLGKIHYAADITLDQPQGYTSEVAKAAKLLLGIGYLTVFLAIAAVVIAVFLGAGRVLVRRMRGKPASSLNDEDFISLKL